MRVTSSIRETVANYIDTHNLDEITEPILTNRDWFTPKDQEWLLNIPVEWIAVGTRGGDWSNRDKRIRINHLLPEDKQVSVFLHELAHAMVYLKYRVSSVSASISFNNDLARLNPSLFGRVQSHGPEWRRFMRMLKQNPERVLDKETSVALTEAAGYSFVYACMDCGVETRRQRRSKKLENPAVWHRGCKHKPNKGRFYLKKD